MITADLGEVLVDPSGQILGRVWWEEVGAGGGKRQDLNADTCLVHHLEAFGYSRVGLRHSKGDTSSPAANVPPIGFTAIYRGCWGILDRG
jgi:hypothetical protein